MTGASQKSFVRHSNIDEWHFASEIEIELPGHKWATTRLTTSQNTYSHLPQQADEAAAYLAILLLPTKVGLRGKAASWIFLSSKQPHHVPRLIENLDTTLLWSEQLPDRKLFRFFEIIGNCDFIQNDDNIYYALYRDIEDNSRQWIERLYKFPENKKWVTSDLKPVLKKVDDLINRTKFAELNGIFEMLDVRRMPPIIMISLLRAAYAYRGGIPNWFSFCIGVRDELRKRKLNAEIASARIIGRR